MLVSSDSTRFLDTPVGDVLGDGQRDTKLFGASSWIERTPSTPVEHPTAWTNSSPYWKVRDKSIDACGQCGSAIPSSSVVPCRACPSAVIDAFRILASVVFPGCGSFRRQEPVFLLYNSHGPALIHHPSPSAEVRSMHGLYQTVSFGTFHAAVAVLRKIRGIKSQGICYLLVQKGIKSRSPPFSQDRTFNW